MCCGKSAVFALVFLFFHVSYLMLLLVVQIAESVFKTVQLRANKNNVRPPHWNTQMEQQHANNEGTARSLHVPSPSVIFLLFSHM
jgi:hypothetical protein